VTSCEAALCTGRHSFNKASALVLLQYTTSTVCSSVLKDKHRTDGTRAQLGDRIVVLLQYEGHLRLNLIDKAQ
jgi:hypothetical protein